MSVKKRLSSSIVGHWDFRKGTLVDQSSGGNDMTFAGSPRWANSPGGTAVQMDVADGYLTSTVVDFQGSSTVGSIEGWIMLSTLGAAQSIFSSADTANGTNYFLFYISATNYITLDCVGSAITNSGLRSNTALEKNRWYHVVVTTDGSTTKFYLDGADDGLTVTSGSDSGNWLGDITDKDNAGIGNLVRNVVSTPSNQTQREVIVWDVELTSLQVSQRYQESLLEAWDNGAPRKDFELPEDIKGNETGLVGGWNMGIEGQTAADVSTGNNALTIAGSVSDAVGLFGRAVELDGSTGYLTKTIADYRIADSEGAVEAWVWIDAIGGAAHYVFASADTGGSTNYMYLAIGSDSIPSFQQRSGDTGDAFSGTNTVNVGEWNHLVWTTEGNGTSYALYLNGFKETLVNLTGSDTGDWFAETALRDNVTVGALIRNTSTGWVNGKIDSVKVHSVEQTQAMVTASYNKGAQKPTYINDFSGVGDSVAALGAGNFIDDFAISTGTYKKTSDGTDHWLECVTAGVAYIESQQAFGTWEYDIYKDLDANNALTGIFDTVDYSNDGYYIGGLSGAERPQITKSVSGTPTNLSYPALSYASIQTKYTMRITRSQIGVFTYYIKGGAFTTWTTVVTTGGFGTNPVTDIAVTTSKYFLAILGAGDKISNIKFFEGVVTPTDLP